MMLAPSSSPTLSSCSSVVETFDYVSTTETAPRYPRGSNHHLPPSHSSSFSALHLQSVLKNRSSESNAKSNSTSFHNRILYCYLLKHWFIIALILLIMLAKLIPDIGREGGILRPEIFVKYIAVVIIFFISGLTLPTSELVNAMSHVRLHIFIQLFNLGVIPILMSLIVTQLRYIVAAGILELDPILLDGLMIAACMPAPVSSAVILTRTIGGNEAAALFNSSLGSFFGVFSTPLLVLLFLGEESTVPLTSIMTNLMSIIIFPLICGQVARKYLWKHRIEALSIPFNGISKSVLLLIIYSTFCETFAVETEISSASLRNIAAVVIFSLCFFTLIAFMLSHSRPFCFLRDDVVAATFCSTQKSLTLGMPMIKVILAGNVNMSTMAVPLLFYHPAQILLGGLLVPWFKAWRERTRTLSRA